jgi:hypothetical protein
MTPMPLCPGIEKGSTAFALTINGESVSDGKMKMHTMLRLLIIIEVTK